MHGTINKLFVRDANVTYFYSNCTYFLQKKSKTPTVLQSTFTKANYSHPVSVSLSSVTFPFLIPVFTHLELGVTEHIEGDECKFAIWTGRAPMISDCRIVMRANSIETKHTWVKKLRQVIQETYFSSSTLNNLIKSPAKATTGSKSAGQRLSKDTTEETALCEPDQDINSLASFGSGNTTDSEKVSGVHFYVHLSVDC